MSNYSYLFKLIIIGDTSTFIIIQVWEKAVFCYTFCKKSFITEVGKMFGLIMIGGLLSPLAVGQRPFKFYQTSFFKGT